MVKKIPDRVRAKATYYLRYTPLVVAIVYLGIAATITHGSMQEKQALEQEFRTIKNRLSNAEWQLSVHEDHYPTYKDMTSKGLIGDSQRLNWLEVLQNIGEVHNIPTIDFSLDSATNADETHPLYQGSLDELFTTHMGLKLKMKHEGDFYQLMTELREKANGVFSVEHCRLQKEGGEIGSAPTISGTCDLEWYGIYDVTIGEEDS